MNVNFLPERVYDIKLEKVVHRSQAGNTTNGYITISHRWNNTESATETFPGISWKCQPSNIIKLKAAIPVAKTHLINHIWMDSICIDQDILKTNVYSMYDIYKHSKMTLAMIDIYEAHEQQIRDESISYKDKFTAFQSIMNQDWWNRVWTLQEMLLSQSRLSFVNIRTKTTICTYDQYKSLYNFYQTQDYYKKQLNEHDINTCLYDNRTPYVRDVLAMCKHRVSTNDEDYAWGITGLLSLKVVFRYNIGKLEALKVIFRNLAKKGDVTFLDYWGPCSKFSYMPKTHKAYELAALHDNNNYPHHSTIDDTGLVTHAYLPVKLVNVKILKISIKENNVAKQFVIAGKSNFEVYKRMIYAIDPCCSSEDCNATSRLAKHHYQKIKYSDASTICKSLINIKLYKDCETVFRPNFENETLFLAETDPEGIQVIGCIYLTNSSVAEDKLQLFITGVPQILHPLVVVYIENNIYRMVGRIKSKTQAYNKEAMRLIIIQ